MIEQNYTSLKLSKLLAEGGFDKLVESCWWRERGKTEWELFTNLDKHAGTVSDFRLRAYDLTNDLLIKYAKELFGEKELRGYSNLMSDNPDITKIIPAYKFHTQVVLDFLQQGKKQKAEDYIWDHCLFNPKNK